MLLPRRQNFPETNSEKDSSIVKLDFIVSVFCRVYGLIISVISRACGMCFNAEGKKFCFVLKALC